MRSGSRMGQEGEGERGWETGGERVRREGETTDDGHLYGVCCEAHEEGRGFASVLRELGREGRGGGQSYHAEHPLRTRSTLGGVLGVCGVGRQVRVRRGRRMLPRRERWDLRWV